MLTGISWYMGLDALAANGITKRLFFLLSDKRRTPADEPLRRVRKSRILLFIGVQLIGFGATFAVTQTIGESRRYTHVLLLRRELFCRHPLTILDVCARVCRRARRPLSTMRCCDHSLLDVY